MSVANLGIRIVLEDGARAGFDALGLSVGRFGGMLGGLGMAWNQLSDTQKGIGVATGLLGLTFGALVGIQKQVISAAGDLDQEMSKLRISVRGADEASGQMKDTLVNLADSSIYATAQIADGFTQLGIDGWNAQQIMGGMGQQATLMAEAMNTSTVPAFNLLGTVMEMYSADASQATQFANDLTFAFYNGGKSVANLQQGFNQVGPTAHQLGISFGELADVMALVGQDGLKGSVGASSLNYFITNLASPTNKAAKELANLGVITVNTSSVGFRQLEVALGNSGKAGEKAASQFDGTYTSLLAMFTAAQKAGALHTDQTFMEWATSTGALKDSLWNAQGQFIGLTGAIQLLGSALQNLNPQQQAEAIQAIFNVRPAKDARDFFAHLAQTLERLRELDKVRQSTDVAQQAAKAINNWNDALKQLGSTWTDSLARIGGSDLGVLRGVVGVVQGLLHAFNTAPESVHTAAASFLAISTVVTGLAFVIGAGVTAWAMFGAVLSPLLPIIGVVLGVVLGVVVGVMLLVHSLHDAQKATSPLHPVFLLLGNMMGTIGNLITKQLGPALASMGVTWGHIGAVLKVVGAIIGGVLVIALAIVVGAILGVVFVLTKLWQFSAFVWNGLIHLIKGAAEWFGNLHKTVSEKITAVQAVIHKVFTFIGSLFTWLYNHNYYVKALVDFIHDKFEWAKMIFFMIVVLIETRWHQFWTTIHDKVSQAWAKITGLLGDAKTKVSSKIDDIKNAILTPITNLGALLKDAAGHAIQMLIDGIKDKAGDVGKAAGDIAGKVTRVLGFHSPPAEGPLADSDQYMPNMMKMYASGINSHAHLVHGAIGNVAVGMQRGINLPAGSYAAGAHSSTSSNGDTHIHIEVAGKEVASYVLDGVNRQLKNSGGGRILR